MENFTGKGKKNKVKDILTIVAFILVFFAIATLIIKVFAPKEYWGRFGSETVTFDIDVDAAMTLKEEDFKDCHTVTMGDFLGSTDTSDFAYIDLISYVESTETLVVVAHCIDTASLPFAIFVRAEGFPQAEVANIVKSKDIIHDYFLKYHYEAYLYMGESNNGNLSGKWGNLASVFFAQIAGVELTTVPGVAAPTADLKFDTKGTFRASDNFMKVITGNKDYPKSAQ